MYSFSASKPIKWLLILVIVLASFNVWQGTAISEPKPPSYLELSFSEPLALNQPTRLAFSVSPRIKTENSVATIILPDKAQLISGETEWTGSLSENDTVTIEADILIGMPGRYKIVGVFNFETEAGKKCSDSKTLFIIISEESTEVSERTFSDMKRMRLKRMLEQRNVKNYKLLPKHDSLRREIENVNRIIAEEND